MKGPTSGNLYKIEVSSYNDDVDSLSSTSNIWYTHGNIAHPNDILFKHVVYAKMYLDTCASHNFISPNCIRSLKDLLEKSENFEAMFDKVKRNVSIKFGNKNVESHDLYEYDILICINNENFDNNKVLFTESFIEYDTGVDIILLYNTLKEHGIFDMLKQNKPLFHQTSSQPSPEELEEDVVMDILAPLSLNDDVNEIDFGPYIHPDVPDREALEAILRRHIADFQQKLTYS